MWIYQTLFLNLEPIPLQHIQMKFSLITSLYPAGMLGTQFSSLVVADLDEIP